MYSVVNAAAVIGIESVPVSVEADVSDGMPLFEMVGFLAGEVREARERVRIALKNSGFLLPPKRITINLTPADIKKSGTGFDLPIAFAVLCALKAFPQTALERAVVAGEIGLNGSILPTRGILPIVEMAKKRGMEKCLVPMENCREAALVSGITVVPLQDIESSVRMLRENCLPVYRKPVPPPAGAALESTAASRIAGTASESTAASRVAGAALESTAASRIAGTASESTAAPPAGAAAGLAESTAASHVTCPAAESAAPPPAAKLDFAEINGQAVLKRACEIAVSGMHNLLMVGPPGAGKTMVAMRIPTILPPLDEKEQMELSKIYSVCGLLDPAKGLICDRPCRMPHHTVTPQALAGGGVLPKPGEISLAHAGVLFLDELPEFKKVTLEILRQPMEERQIRLSRLSGVYTFPCDFMLVAAMNPCKCGFYPDRNKCSCSESSIRRYLSGISQPLLDRIDICAEAPRIAYQDLVGERENETSAQIRARVVKAHQIQKERYRGEDFLYNSQIPSSKTGHYCRLPEKLQEYMKQMFARLDLSARAYYKILKVARTIADLAGSPEIQGVHLMEAVCYRSIDKKFWGNEDYDI